MYDRELRFNTEYASVSNIRQNAVKLEREYRYGALLHQVPHAHLPRMIDVTECQACGMDNVPVWDNPRINHTWCLGCRTTLARAVGPQPVRSNYPDMVAFVEGDLEDLSG